MRIGLGAKQHRTCPRVVASTPALSARTAASSTPACSATYSATSSSCIGD